MGALAQLGPVWWGTASLQGCRQTDGQAAGCRRGLCVQTAQPRGPRGLPGSRRNGAAGAGPHQGCPWGRDQWRSRRGRACVRAGHLWTPSWASTLGSCSHYQRGKGSSPGLLGGGVFPEPRTESGSVAWAGEGSAEGAGRRQCRAFSLGWEGGTARRGLALVPASL